MPGRRIVISGSSKSRTVGVTKKKLKLKVFSKRRSNHDGRYMADEFERDETPQKLRPSVGVKVSREMERSGDLVETRSG